MNYLTYYNSPVDKLTIASDGKRIIGLWLENQKYYLNGLTDKLIFKDDLPIFIKTKDWLDRYFSKKRPEIKELDLAISGSDFRKNVLKLLCEIPYGKTITCNELAKELAKKMNKKTMSARAIGNAVGHNPISIIIPCHRVIGTNGKLTGYAGGLDKKIKLLTLEGVKDIKNKF